MSLPVGELVSLEPAQSPTGVDLCGKHTWLTRLRACHSDSLFKHLGGESRLPLWTYMLTSGFTSTEECQTFISNASEKSDPFFYSVYDGPAENPDSEIVGMMSYMNSVPAHRRIEIGSVILGEKLSKTRQATEAFYLFIKHAIDDLGYQRVEWKANHLNAPSLAAAERLGFTFEGIFRKHMVIKGRRRDTAWFSITDSEWPRIKRGFEAWLADTNFDEFGRQKKGLKECRESFGDE